MDNGGGRGGGSAEEGEKMGGGFEHMSELNEDLKLAEKQARVIKRQTAKNEMRQQELARLREESADLCSPNESTASFLEKFSIQRRQIEVGIGAIDNGIVEGKEDDDVETNTLKKKKQLDSMAESLRRLEESLAAGSYFLPRFDLRLCQNIITKLKDDLTAARVQNIPKKKFSFASKKSGVLLQTTSPSSSDRLQPPFTSSSSMASVSAPSCTAPSLFQSKANFPSPRAQTWNGKSASSAPTKMTTTFSRKTAASCKDVLPPYPSTAPSSLTIETGVTSGGSTTQSRNGMRGLRGVVCVRTRDDGRGGGEYTISDMTECHIFLLGIVNALFIHNVRNVKLYSGPVTGAVHVEGASDCIFMLASHQIRIHSTERSDFYLRVRSGPIVEHSVFVRFAPYAFHYEGIEEDLSSASLAEDAGLWEKVEDFGWLRASKSPNWGVVPDGERSPRVIDTVAIEMLRKQSTVVYAPA